MTVSFKDKIAVVGVGCTRFAENFDLSYSDMLAEACFQAFEEARVEPKDIEAAWLSTAFVDASAMKGRSGMDLAEAGGSLRHSHHPGFQLLRLRRKCLSRSLPGPSLRSP